ncbi:UNVERIFIED_CONTAM: hypothetical protein K2H54_029072, partial [Gekko kuhli]
LNDGGKAANANVGIGDVVLSIDGVSADGMTHLEAQNKIKTCSGKLTMNLQRRIPGKERAGAHTRVLTLAQLCRFACGHAAAGLARRRYGDWLLVQQRCSLLPLAVGRMAGSPHALLLLPPLLPELEPTGVQAGAVGALSRPLGKEQRGRQEPSSGNGSEGRATVMEEI